MELNEALKKLELIGKKNNNCLDEKILNEYVSEFDYEKAINYLDGLGISIISNEYNNQNIINDYESISKSSDVLKIYFTEIGKYKILTYDEEISLFKIYKNGKIAKDKILKIEADDLNQVSEKEYKELYDLADKADLAYEKIVNSNLKLVASIAKHYSKRGLSLMDLIQEGNVGLTRAIDKFDFEKGNKFSTYATPWIKQGITRALTDKSRTIRLPSHLLETISKIKKCEDELEASLKRKPTYDELSAKLNIPKEKITNILNSYQSPISLEQSVGDEDDATIGDFVPDRNSLNPLEYCEKLDLKKELNKILTNNLTEREIQIIKLRYGFDDGLPKTLEEIGKIMGNISKERIRQIEIKVLRKLRNINQVKQLIESYRK